MMRHPNTVFLIECGYVLERHDRSIMICKFLRYDLVQLHFVWLANSSPLLVYNTARLRVAI